MKIPYRLPVAAFLAGLLCFEPLEVSAWGAMPSHISHVAAFDQEAFNQPLLFSPLHDVLAEGYAARKRAQAWHTRPRLTRIGVTALALLTLYPAKTASSQTNPGFRADHTSADWSIIGEGSRPLPLVVFRGVPPELKAQVAWMDKEVRTFQEQFTFDSNLTPQPKDGSTTPFEERLETFYAHLVGALLRDAFADSMRRGWRTQEEILHFGAPLAQPDKKSTNYERVLPGFLADYYARFGLYLLTPKVPPDTQQLPVIELLPVLRIESKSPFSPVLGRRVPIKIYHVGKSLVRPLLEYNPQLADRLVGFTPWGANQIFLKDAEFEEVFIKQAQDVLKPTDTSAHPLERIGRQLRLSALQRLAGGADLTPSRVSSLLRLLILEETERHEVVHAYQGQYLASLPFPRRHPHYPVWQEMEGDLGQTFENRLPLYTVGSLFQEASKYAGQPISTVVHALDLSVYTNRLGYALWRLRAEGQKPINGVPAYNSSIKFFSKLPSEARLKIWEAFNEASDTEINTAVHAVWDEMSKTPNVLTEEQDLTIDLLPAAEPLPTPAEQPAKSTHWLPWGVAGLGLFAAGIMTFFFVRRRNSGKPPTPTLTPRKTRQPPPSPPKNNRRRNRRGTIAFDMLVSAATVQTLLLVRPGTAALLLLVGAAVQFPLLKVSAKKLAVLRAA